MDANISQFQWPPWSIVPNLGLASGLLVLSDHFAHKKVILQYQISTWIPEGNRLQLFLKTTAASRQSLSFQVRSCTGAYCNTCMSQRHTLSYSPNSSVCFVYFRIPAGLGIPLLGSLLFVGCSWWQVGELRQCILLARKHTKSFGSAEEVVLLVLVGIAHPWCRLHLHEKLIMATSQSFILQNIVISI